MGDFIRLCRPQVLHLKLYYSNHFTSKRADLNAVDGAIRKASNDPPYITGVHLIGGQVDQEDNSCILFKEWQCQLGPTLWLVPIEPLQQYVGRLHRLHENKRVVQVYDYVDAVVPMLRRMFERRLRGYRAIGYVAESNSAPDSLPHHGTAETQSLWSSCRST